MLDYIRIACAVPRVQVGEVRKNVENICERIREADAGKADVVVFPELALTGYTCADLFFQETLLRACREGRIDLILCKSVSRFGRNSVDVLRTIRALRERNIGVLFEKEAVDTRTMN